MSLKLHHFLDQNKELFWDVKDISKLSDLAVENRILKYGDWKNIQELINLFGKDIFKKNYEIIKNKSRCDLHKRTINFFNLYLR